MVCTFQGAELSIVQLSLWDRISALAIKRSKMKTRPKNRPRSVPATANALRPSLRRDFILLTLCVLLLCGIFLGKAYNMDDPLVVWTAQRIAAHPVDFYGFDVNWYGYNTPMELTDLNPPGAAYYLATFGALFHWRESAMHVAFALVAVALILGMYWLARLMGGEPLPAAVIALVSPGVFVSMGTVMTDLPMTALWVWAIALWLSGLNEEYPTANAASGLLIGLAALAKYFALSLVPLLLVYTLLSARKRWVRLVWLIVPVVIIGLFELYTQWLYGVGQIRGILGIVKQYHELYTINVGRKFLTGLTFLGAGAAPVLFIAPWLWRRRGRIALCAGGVGVAALTFILAQSGWQAGEPRITYSWWFWPQYGLWLLAGIHIIVLTVAEIWTQRDRDSVLLGLWLGGTLFYCIVVYHLVNIRVILPALPVVMLVCARRLRRLHAESKVRAPALPKDAWFVLAASLVLCLCVAWSDIKLANSAQTAAERIAPEKRVGRTWFQGHWGFQYYMERRSAKPIDSRHLNLGLRLGDAVVTPENSSNRIFTWRPNVATVDESFEVPVCNWLTTMRAECGAGIYADLWGPLPFVFGPVPAEKYEVRVWVGRQGQ